MKKKKCYFDFTDGFLFVPQIQIFAENNKYTVEQVINMIFRVKFTKENKGFVIVHVCKIKEKNEIRSIEFALPILRNKANERMEEILKGLTELE